MRDDVEALAEVIDGHDWSPTVVGDRFPFRAGCSCGWIGEAEEGGPAHSAHVAEAVLTSPWLAAHAAAARAAAWDEGWRQGTGDAWQNGGHKSKPNPHHAALHSDPSEAGA